MSGAAPAEGSAHEAGLPAPVTEEELAACVQVLDRVSKHLKQDGGKDFYESKGCRGLRKALAPFAKLSAGKMYGGTDLYEYETKKRLNKEAAGKRNREKQLDTNYRNNVLLRQERIRKLHQVQEEHDQSALPMIADGPAEVTEPSPEADEPESKRAKLGSEPAAAGEDAPELHKARSCYVCKVRFRKLHFFYDQLCAPCAQLNWHKRSFERDLTGMAAIVTGCRVKIGFHVSLKLLRAGATVIGTTRFSRDAAERFAAEADFDSWRDRLELHGLDLRDLGSIERFCEAVKANHPNLRILVNNACQTIRRPAAYYAPLVDKEKQPLSLEAGALLCSKTAQTAKSICAGSEGGEAVALVGSQEALSRPELQIGSKAMSAAMKSQIVMLDEDQEIDAASLPLGKVDANTGQQLDLRTHNSWITTLQSVQTPELLEVFAINAIAPFVLNARLASMMQAATPSFIVNVSAMEGKFYRVKSPNHPHTNMAKAALNMMTKTSASDLANKGVFMTSVDTGWINDENPLGKAKAYAEKHNFQTPIDEIDAAARILDPVFSGLGDDKPAFGVFFKDYHETEW